MVKLCSNCSKEKEVINYYKSKHTKDGLYSYCKECARLKRRSSRSFNPERAREVRYAWNKKNPTKVKESSLRCAYGMTLFEYEELNKKQNSLCAICFKTNDGKPLFVDHDHTTNKIRELLCSQCNSAIGLMKEDILILKSAITYLEKHS